MSREAVEESSDNIRVTISRLDDEPDEDGI